MCLVHPLCKALPVVVEKARVHVQRDGRRRMAAHSLDSLYVGLGTDRKRDRRMSELMWREPFHVVCER